MSFLDIALLWLHFFGLALGMGSGMALGVLAPAVLGAPEGQKDRMWSLYGALGRNAQVGLGLLIVTGLALVFTRYGGVAGLNVWFWVKMALVVVLIVSVAIGTRAGRAIRGGDTTAVATGKLAGAVNGLSGIMIIGAAVMAFE